jgi:hypothetical protein
MHGLCQTNPAKPPLDPTPIRQRLLVVNQRSAASTPELAGVQIFNQLPVSFTKAGANEIHGKAGQFSEL